METQKNEAIIDNDRIQENVPESSIKHSIEQKAGSSLFERILNTSQSVLSSGQDAIHISEAISQNGISRRTLLKVTGIASGSFTLAACLPDAKGKEVDLEGMANQFILNAFIHISPEGKIILFSHTPEMGQGVKTSIPMVLAEELGADWKDVEIVQAPVNQAVYGEQRAGGSRSTQRTFNPMREMGAAAKRMFVEAAAKKWNVSASEIFTEKSKVIHKPSKKSLTFASLASDAARQSIPKKESLVFKKRSEYTLLGTEIGGVDNKDIVTGAPQFTTDLKIPGMVYAVYEKCPAFFGKVKSANIEEVKKLPGVIDVFILDGNGEVNELLSGVAVVAKTTWQAFSARNALKIEWDESTASKDSWKQLQINAKNIALKDGKKEIVHVGDVKKEFENTENKTLESFYTHPFVAHACMEPMGCAAHYKPASDGQEESLEVWAPTQAPTRIYGMVEKMLGIPARRVTVNQMRMGGAFGRRGRTDFSCEVSTISKRVKAPVKLMWSREDDMAHDFYRAGGFYSLKGAVDKKGKLAAMENHLIAMATNGEPVTGSKQYATEFPGLNIPNYRGTTTYQEIKTPCGPWRAPGSNVSAWAVQSFLAEMSDLAGRDHLEFLLEIMGEPRWFEPGNIRSLNTGRASDVIKLAAEKAGWGRQMPKGRGLGLSFYFSHASHVAEVAEVSVDENKKLTIHKVTVAADIGPVMNMSGAKSQVEGSVVDGLSTMLDLEITMENGRIEQNNFHTYRPMRIAHSPEIDVHFIQSDNGPTGIGEPALPPLAPAIGNAIFAATGERVKTMPITAEGYRV
ncbi:MAG: molybdopterin-dependent oxidoreductase [Cellvibrionaceae bacterium]